jgi:flavin-dependent thymidylate synthase
MKVTLISHTQNALELLVDTKHTRMRGKTADQMTEAERYEHFQYMLDTIRSPFEFVDYIFQIEGVSKNFTHQLVRTRTGAYQQETSRALEISAFDTIKPKAFDGNGQIDTPLNEVWADAIADADANYKQLIAMGADLQDARAILPSNMATKIMAKFNLRTLSDMAKNRLCARTQGEYQEVFRAMRAAVLEVHPWSDPLLQVACVATGQCAFPRWGSKVIETTANVLGRDTVIGQKYQCPHYRPWMDLSAQKEALRVSFWSKEEIAQANPVAKNGVSM